MRALERARCGPDRPVGSTQVRRLVAGLLLLGCRAPAALPSPPPPKPVPSAPAPSASAPKVASSVVVAPEAHVPALDVDREIRDGCLWSSDEHLGLCTFRRDENWSLTHELSFVGTKGRTDTILLVKFKGDAFHDPPPSLVPEARRASLRERVEKLRYRALTEDECQTLEPDEKPAKVVFPRFSLTYAVLDHGFGCPGGWCGKANGRFTLSCGKKSRTVLELTGNSVPVNPSGRACFVDDRYLLLDGEIGGRNEGGYLGERSAVVVDLSTECP